MSSSAPSAARVRSWALLCLSIALVLLGGGLGAAVQTGFGTVSVRDISFVGDNGELIAAKLYVPREATPDTPAPGILAIHGANNSSEMQDAYAIELSRRGYVVMAPDQHGHGGSDGSEESGPIAPSALRHLHGMPMVDADNIGIGGHSRGGAESYLAAALEPDLYQAIVFEASGPVPQVLPDPENPPALHNALYIMTTFEEFAAPVWGEAVPGKVPDGAFARSVMDVDRVEPGRTYGDFADGTARQMVMVGGNHPLMTFSPAAVQHAIDWYGESLDGGRQVDGQIWFWKEIGGGISLLGAILAVFAVGGLLWSTPAFAAAKGDALSRGSAPSRRSWWGAALLTGLIPVATYWPLQEWGNTALRGLPWWPQFWANGVMVWAVGNAVISAVLLTVWYLRGRRTASVGPADLGLGASGTRAAAIGRSLLAAGAGVGAAYLLLALSDWLFKTDFRIYTMALAVIDARHLPLFLWYLVPFIVFFLVAGAGMVSQLRPVGSAQSTGRRMLVLSLVFTAPLLLFFVADYLPILFGGTMLVDEPLKSQLVLIGYQFLVLLPVAACLIVYFHRISGTVYTGAVAAAMLVVWNLTTTTTVHIPDGGEWGAGALIVRVVLPALLGVIALIAALRLRRAPERLGVPDPGTVMS